MNRTTTMLVLGTLLLGLPLAGLWLAELPLTGYWECPPITRREPAAFAWLAFGVLAAIEVPLYAPVVALLRSIRLGTPAASFPRWGWIAMAWTLTWWIVAWTRFPCFAAFQQHTYTPLWLGYIALVNAITFQRTGRCLLTHEPRRLAALFLASGAFWWFFEYLNRFVQNWWYDGIADFSPLRYVLFATPAFSTVLPAVLGTAALLETFLPAGALGACRPRLPVGSRGSAVLLLLVACAGLAGIGVWPDYCYPLLWLAPLFLLTAFRGLRGEDTILTPATRGDWRRIAVLMTAALLCGFFWEMWNAHSLAKWLYEVPFVGRFHLFEMPLAGFAGYLPFGLECAVVADALGRKRE